MKYQAFIHNEDLDDFIDFIKNIDPDYQIVYRLQSIPYFKIEMVMRDEDLLAAKLIFCDLHESNCFHPLK